MYTHTLCRQALSELMLSEHPNTLFTALMMIDNSIRSVGKVPMQ